MDVGPAAERRTTPDGGATPDEAPAPAGRGQRRIRGLSAEERQERRRQQLLAAALDLFADGGFGGTSIEQICQAAYVGTKGFYELFDSKEACFLALLRSVSAGVQRRMEEAWASAPDDEEAATGTLVAAFAGALVDDPRVARVTFAHASGISPVIERERRRNRRWAATFVVALWERHDALAAGAPVIRTPPADDDRRYRLALGLVGGLFELVADWLLDGDPARPEDRRTLVEQLTRFAQTVRAGVRAAPATTPVAAPQDPGG